MVVVVVVFVVSMVVVVVVTVYSSGSSSNSGFSGGRFRCVYGGRSGCIQYVLCCVYSGNKVFLTSDVTGNEIPFPDLNLSLWLCAGVLEWRSHLACCGGKGDLDLPAQLPRSARFLGRHLRLQHLQKRRAQCR